VNALFVLGLDAILRAVSGNMSWAVTASAMVAAGIIVVLVLLGRRRWREAEAAPIA
jgi:hypothetical protein